MTVPEESASANSVPAAAVIRRRQALSGIIGRKASVGGFLKSAVKDWGLTPERPWKLKG